MMSAVYSRRASNRRTGARRRRDQAEADGKGNVGAWRSPPKAEPGKVAVEPGRSGRPGRASLVARSSTAASPSAAKPAAAPTRKAAPDRPPLAWRAALMARHAPSSRLARDLRPIGEALVARAWGPGAQPPDRVVLVTSPGAGDGKTFVTAELALALCLGAARRVLLIDAAAMASGERPAGGLADRLGMAAAAGLSDALATPELDLEQLVQSTDLEGLALLGPGRAHRRPIELLATGRLVPVTRALRDADPERLILIDGPPLLVGPEARVLALIAGQVIVVAAAGATSLAALDACRKLLAEHDGVGLVLNRASSLATTAAGRPPADPAPG